MDHHKSLNVSQWKVDIWHMLDDELKYFTFFLISFTLYKIRHGLEHTDDDEKHAENLSLWNVTIFELASISSVKNVDLLEFVFSD